MTASFHIDIVSPDKVVYKGECVSLVVPAEYGYLGVLAHHAPLVAHIKPGTVTFRDDAGVEKRFALDGEGFLEVSKNRATLVVTNIRET